MPSQYTSEKMTIGALLSMTSPNIVVPEWQRNFSWKLTEIEIFWQDLVSFSRQYQGDNINDQEYFLGSIVMVNNVTSHLLLDGQQRLAVATILLSVIRDNLKSYNANAATRTSQKYIADFDDASEKLSFKLTLNKYDSAFFRVEIQEPDKSEDKPPDTLYASHKLIRKAREFFIKRFEERNKNLGGGKKAFHEALRIQKVLTEHVSVVAVTSTDEDNAANVFETLNDRGIGLSTPDLLRNLLLRRAPESDRAEIIECWKSVFELEDSAKVDDFLRHYWYSLRGDVKARSLYREIKKAILEEDTSSLSFSRDLKTSAIVYGDIVASRDDDTGVQRLLEDVSMLGAKSLRPPILSAFIVFDTDEKVKVLQALTTLYVRHNVICNLENSRLETFLFNAARELREKKDSTDVISKITKWAPSNEQFLERFKTAAVSRIASARYILKELEYALRKTQELSVETPDRVHVEHIYSKTPKDEDRLDNHETLINRIGNLTLLAKRLNQSIKNAGFSTKKQSYKESDLLLTKDLLKYDSWDDQTISKRQIELSEKALAIWNFPES